MGPLLSLKGESGICEGRLCPIVKTGRPVTKCCIQTWIRWLSIWAKVLNERPLFQKWSVLLTPF